MRFAIATTLVGVAALTVAAAAQSSAASGPSDCADDSGRNQAAFPWERISLFRAVSVSIPPGQKISLSASNSILYQLSGATEIADGETKTITAGAGALIAGGTSASMTAGTGEPSTLLYFLLAPKDALYQPIAAAPATIKELYRTPAPLPGLKPGEL